MLFGFIGNVCICILDQYIILWFTVRISVAHAASSWFYFFFFSSPNQRSLSCEIERIKLCRLEATEFARLIFSTNFTVKQIKYYLLRRMHRPIYHSTQQENSFQWNTTHRSLTDQYSIYMDQRDEITQLFYYRLSYRKKNLLFLFISNDNHTIQHRLLAGIEFGIIFFFLQIPCVLL